MYEECAFIYTLKKYGIEKISLFLTFHTFKISQFSLYGIEIAGKVHR